MTSHYFRSAILVYHFQLRNDCKYNSKLQFKTCFRHGCLGKKPDLSSLSSNWNNPVLILGCVAGGSGCARPVLILACVAGGSGCARETFCAEAANSFAAKPAREFSRAANSTRLLPILLTTPAAFCTRVRDQSSRGHPLPLATQAMLISKENIFKRTA